jgi:hypothetical protein
MPRFPTMMVAFFIATSGMAGEGKPSHPERAQVLRTHIPHPFEANRSGIIGWHLEVGSRNAEGFRPRASRKAN